MQTSRLKNIRNNDRLIYGRGSIGQLGDILKPQRHLNDGYVVFVVDDYFEGKSLVTSLPKEPNDQLFYVDVNQYEPKTEQIDDLRDRILLSGGIPAVIVGIGGGSAMDIAKAVSVMLTNPGPSSDYQGLDLAKIPGVYSVGIPTVSGTGAECSTTAVLTGPIKKLGIKCEYTPFNQIVLDPDLIASVPKNQWFYTGMDTYIHDMESSSGMFYNTFSAAYGDQSIELCHDVFLRDGCGQSPENDEKLMVASLFGGLSLTYSEVGVCHALSYGLSYVFGTRHGYANCMAFNHLEEYYGDSVKDFKRMVEIHEIDLPQNQSANWTEEEIRRMAEISYNLPHMWHHALGPDWATKISIEQIMDLFRRM
jgi:3-deoxy-alpha-D-manno-octulosonate 8-oxidase